MELQADCLAGVWAKLNHQLKKRLEPGDIEEGLNAASAIGDDMIQSTDGGRRGARRLHARLGRAAHALVHEGYKSGKMQSCDTFNTDDL